MPGSLSAQVITFIVPSRSRVGKLRTLVNSVRATCNLPTRFLIGFDDDMASFTQYRSLPDVNTVLLHPRHYFVGAMNQMFQMACRRWPDLDWIVCCNDDDEFCRWNWGPWATAEFEQQFPDGYGVLELFFQGGMHTYLTRAKLYTDHFGGYLYNPAYTQYHADREMVELLREKNQYAAVGYDLANPVVRHAYETATSDTLNVEVFQVWNGIDTATFELRAKGIDPWRREETA